MTCQLVTQGPWESVTVTAPFEIIFCRVGVQVKCTLCTEGDRRLSHNHSASTATEMATAGRDMQHLKLTLMLDGLILCVRVLCSLRFALHFPTAKAMPGTHQVLKDLSLAA